MIGKTRRKEKKRNETKRKEKKPPFKAKKKKISTADLKKGTSQDIPKTVPEWFLKLEEQQREKEERIERLEQNAEDIAAADLHKQTDQFKETESGLDTETGEQLSAEERKRRFKLRKKNISTDKFFGREEKSVEADTTGASDLAVIKKDKVEAMEASGQAALELAGEDLESKFAALEGDNDIEKELETLRIQMKSGVEASS